MPAKYRPDQDAHRRLRHAAWKGDVRLARAMLGRGAKLEATDGDKYTPLLIAARWNRQEMVQVRNFHQPSSHRPRASWLCSSTGAVC
jgi:hypothetical protein